MINDISVDRIIENALAEDMPFGDITTDSIFDGTEESKAHMIAKEAGVIAGLWTAEKVFKKVDENTEFTKMVKEGDFVEKGTVIALIEGKSAALLKAERVALNFLQRMSGIATVTRRISKKLEGTGTVIADTRKTTPGLRVLEKYAVRIGGGTNHRYSLSDAVMIKDNHIKAAGGISEAVRRVRKWIPHTAKIEVETTCIEEVSEAVDAGADIIMLDNMDPETIRQAAGIAKGRASIEVSGNVTEENAAVRAMDGVDVISSGALTHSVKAMDISMKIL